MKLTAFEAIIKYELLGHFHVIAEFGVRWSRFWREIQQLEYDKPATFGQFLQELGSTFQTAVSVVYGTNLEKKKKEKPGGKKLVGHAYP